MKMKIFCRSTYLLLYFVSVCFIHAHQDAEADSEGSGKLITDLIKGDDNRLLVLSTLDGSLIGIDHKTGVVKWKLKNDPMVKVPVHRKNALSPIFLPDPKDGSLYLVNTAETKVLKKLPFSIQQLVASSPCRSNDGIFYTGKKIDSWISVDWKTGKRTSMLSFDHQEKTCPMGDSDSMFIGRTEYSIMMYDNMKENRQWNITYYDYSSTVMTPEELKGYGFVHISASGSGRVRTVVKGSGTVLWDEDYGSPLVGLYVRRGQDILSLPFTSLADTTLNSLSYLQPSDRLLPTLYIGEHEYGLYALPSLADLDLQLLPSSGPSNRLMIEGPNETNEVLFLGHYQMPDVSKTQLQIAGRSDPIIFPNRTDKPRKMSLKVVESQTQTEAVKSEISHENKLLSIIVAALAVTVIAMFFYFRAKMRDIEMSSQGSSHGSNSSGVVLDTQHGVITIGKISFNTQHILGKGCEGTFVFRGEFDGRSVAVKRLLPDCFTVADREVSLLRESDAHPNVIRYFCMEQDAQFRYIALELCSASLQDYVERGTHKEDIGPIETLQQATSGLGHLHSLNIVHRDVKPHNILLWWSGGGEVRALISDFGLCKKLQNGRVSFSRRSGITGTDGWIAPEMIEATGRTMCAVDIFSLGCVFYYVLTNGKHPFGEPLRRQANILSGDYRLIALDDELWRVLIDRMISQDPLKRPSIPVIINHPVFWSKPHILTFLQEVSDRVEKESLGSLVLEAVERGGGEVTGGDWRRGIHPGLASELGKYRTYRGDSLRDLLRALRNKKHHYRELSNEAQAVVGSTGESYMAYWLERFPLLLYHSWTSMQALKSEPGFAQYYHPTYTFPGVKCNHLPAWLAQEASPRKKATAKEEWIKTGKESGAWRPRHNTPKRKKKETEDNFIWKVHT